jgi:hypothetical protein
MSTMTTPIAITIAMFDIPTINIMPTIGTQHPTQDTP